MAAASRRPFARQAERGLSMVELLVGTAIALFIAATGATMLASNLRENRALLLEARLMQDLRSAADVITRDLRRAGYAVYPLASGQWSGRTTLQPVGWSIGSGAADRRVCRYSADLDGSGAIDANIEHPARYVAVETTLANQNFLVIQGTEICPVGRAVQVAGRGADIDVDVGTVQHQP